MWLFFCPVFIGVSGNELLCKFSCNSCPSHSQLNGFLMGYWTANWPTLLWLCEAVAAFLPKPLALAARQSCRSAVPSASRGIKRLLLLPSDLSFDSLVFIAPLFPPLPCRAVGHSPVEAQALGCRGLAPGSLGVIAGQCSSSLAELQ